MKQLAGIWQNLCRRVAALAGDEKRRLNLLVALGLTGMALLCLSEWLPSGDTKQEPVCDAAAALVGEEEFVCALETRLSETLSSMDGVGRCKVMVTLATGERTVYAQDTEQSGEEMRTEHVVLGQQALVEGTRAPDVQGVAVVCDGGDNAAVQYAVTQTVAALTGIGTNRITVSRMAVNGQSE